MTGNAARRSVVARAGADGHACLDIAEEFTRRLSGSVDHGIPSVISEAERGFAALLRARAVHMVLHTGGVWRKWRQLETPDGASCPLEGLPQGADTASLPVVFGDVVFVPVRPGSAGALAVGGCPDACLPGTLSLLAACTDLALTACERRDASLHGLDEVQVMQRVANRILKSHDLQEILLLVTHETKRLLVSDICGILLREEEELVMRGCVGNFSAQTASLRMHGGQGIAGQVLAEACPCSVDDYVHSTNISQDFFALARMEMVRSALAVPLLSSSDVIGVLEVWRRRPSTFTAADRDRLLALAGLASLAIENARLSQAREQTVRDLASANAALEERYQTIHSAARFEQELLALLLERRSLFAVAQAGAVHVGGRLFVLDADLGLEAAFPAEAQPSETLRRHIGAAIRREAHLRNHILTHLPDEGFICIRPILPITHRLGWVVMVSEAAADEPRQMALSQLAVIVALHVMERRATAKARGETLEAILWDLLEGGEEARRLALDRAREMQVEWAGQHFLVLCSFDSLDRLATIHGWTAADLDSCRESILERARRSRLGGAARLIGLRGTQLRMICCSRAGLDPMLAAEALAKQIAGMFSSFSVHIGLSDACEGPTSLSTAFREARTALEVSRQRGEVAIAHYRDVGVLGMFLNLRGDAHPWPLIDHIFGPVMRESPQSRRVLLDTLRAFFAANCSQVATAQRLHTHQKTVAYRLGKISKLTGLDLSRHQDRMLADMALRLQDVSRKEEFAQSR